MTHVRAVQGESIMGSPIVYQRVKQAQLFYTTTARQNAFTLCPFSDGTDSQIVAGKILNFEQDNTGGVKDELFEANLLST